MPGLLGNTAELAILLKLKDEFSGPMKSADSQLQGLHSRVGQIGTGVATMGKGLAVAAERIAMIGVAAGVAVGGIAVSCHEERGVLLVGDEPDPDAGRGVGAGSHRHEQGRARDGGFGRLIAGRARHRPLPHRVGRHPRGAGARCPEDGGAGRGGRRLRPREHDERADRHGQVRRGRHHVDEPGDGRPQRHRRQRQHADAGSRRRARHGPPDQGQDVRREHPVGRRGARQHDQSGRARRPGGDRDRLGVPAHGSAHLEGSQGARVASGSDNSTSPTRCAARPAWSARSSSSARR